MHPPPENIETLGLAWGQERWRRMTWRQVFVIIDLVDGGFDGAVTDIDVAWIRHPWPLFDRQPQADILFSHDGITNRNQHPKEEDLELARSAHYNLNTGIYIVRSKDATRATMSAWASSFISSDQHDQAAMYSLLRNGIDQPTGRNDLGLKPAFNNQLLVGIIAAYLFGNAHTYSVSRFAISISSLPGRLLLSYGSLWLWWRWIKKAAAVVMSRRCVHILSRSIVLRESADWRCN